MKQAGLTADPNVYFPNQLLDKLPVNPTPGKVYQLLDFYVIF